jgi:hypothetical protein
MATKDLEAHLRDEASFLTPKALHIGALGQFDELRE